MDYLERLRKLCLAYDGVYEDFPWSHETPVFKNAKGKIFAMSGVEGRTLRVTVKLTPDEGAEAMMLPFVEKAAYVGRFGWVSVTVAGESEWEIAEPWVRRSYELVAGKAKERR